MVDPDNETKNISFLRECIGHAVIDSGCSSTVCGKEWFHAYLDFLKSNRIIFNVNVTKVFKAIQVWGRKGNVC